MWFWRDTLGIRELAIATARETCAHRRLQFLDATVALQNITLSRAPSGQVQFRRTFLFAYSETGDDRQTGFIITLGNHVEQVGL